MRVRRVRARRAFVAERFFVVVARALDWADYVNAHLGPLPDISEKRCAAIEWEELLRAPLIDAHRLQAHPFYTKFFETFAERATSAEDVLIKLDRRCLEHVNFEFLIRVARAIPTWLRDDNAIANSISICLQICDPNG